MSLITRCPACGTMFKVVADQLKIAQGWVRCGYCSDVFDAAAHLLPRAPPAPAGALILIDSDAALPADTLDAAAALEPDTFSAALPEAAAPGAEPREGTVMAMPLSRPEVPMSLPPDMSADVCVPSVSPEPLVLSDPGLQAPEDGALGESGAAARESIHDVSFVREARRDAYWSRPSVRGSLGVAALALSAGLLLQAALFQRNTLAAWLPGLSPGLQTLCTHLHCEVEPLQQIESLVIDSSSFNKIGADAYRLKVVIKNAGLIALAMPSLELTLTDAQEHALLRRVLAPAELGATATTLAAGAEVAGVVALRISNPIPGASSGSAIAPPPSGPWRIAGYRVLAFYP